MVFQGTVFGPALWNIFFADVHGPAEDTGAKENKFADDLSTMQAYHKHVSNEEIIGDLDACQASVHGWFVRNRVTFDPAKEEFVVLNP